MTNMASEIKVALIDDHILLRDALAAVIAGFDHCRVTILANNGRHFIEHMKTCQSPDLVILDINMPVMDGFETARWIKDNYPALNILILTMFDSEIALIRLLQTGVKAFLKKDTHPAELEFAIESIVANGFYYSQNSSGKLANAYLNPNRSFGTPPVKLSENEIRFLKFSSTELTYKEIAKQMFISPRTVDNYRDSLFDKLNVKSRVGLAMYALKNGIVNF
ncbi:MAG TPA: response regulator transcription factor [Chitinophagaceae bacterium]|jgi:DNA-binding NarL/FixJ family response regulator|nr:response regulator transcription factor [Chitinophagaceae bacterium]